MTINMGAMYETGYKHGYTKSRSELTAEIEALKIENTRLRGEVAYTKLGLDQALKSREQLRKSVDYWSYCTRHGMHELCPEKSNELKEFNIELGISPA